MNSCIGTCSLCGGRVVVPEVWMSVEPTVPECESCGATKREHGPVIEMEPRRYGDPFGTFRPPTTYEAATDYDPAATWDGRGPGLITGGSSVVCGGPQWPCPDVRFRS